MSRHRCRLLDRPESEREVEVDFAADSTDGAEYAPDYYVREHCDDSQPGVAFVEVLDGAKWRLWRVEIIAPGMYGTALVSVEDARAEMAAEAARRST